MLQTTMRTVGWVDSYFNEVDGKNGHCHCTLPDIVAGSAQYSSSITKTQEKHCTHLKNAQSGAKQHVPPEKSEPFQRTPSHGRGQTPFSQAGWYRQLNDDTERFNHLQTALESSLIGTSHHTHPSNPLEQYRFGMTFGLPQPASFPSCRQKLFRPHASSCGVPFYRPKPPLLSPVFIAPATMLVVKPGFVAELICVITASPISSQNPSCFKCCLR